MCKSDDPSLSPTDLDIQQLRFMLTNVVHFQPVMVVATENTQMIGRGNADIRKQNAMFRP